ncbi:putative multicopper oxidase [Daldinia caldariorum]|uniref:putative multicopper oxidase n=1 Tax=Daldinia caldariorum TaxID=326644 RepID=UPI0020087BAF|nr:putative multicopper oxidase [Daldinia caldariorum]KAI1473144.1 putative multicopper oxidase [Daldinia caldariorum]
MISSKLPTLLLPLLCGTVAASPFLPSPNLYPRAACSGNTATTRNEWCDFSIDTDYTTEVPDTGVTKEYWLDITDVTVSPDGVSRSAMAVNGSFPGPTLFADWGDTVVVHVTNSMTTSNNGTSIHFHGIRQNYTNEHDGVVSITQCPTAPGDTRTYTWRATQYGTTWYHSHFALQAWEGVAGAIIINGPATANYDEDIGTIILSDWSHQTVDQLWTQAQTSGPPTMDNGLLNGTNVYNDTGSRLQVSFTSGTSYRIRLINTAIDTHFKFSIDNHTMQVIAADLVPIQPYEATVINVGIAQRYDVIVTADQASVADNFWMRAIPQSACSATNDNADNIRGIVSYTDTASEPETTGYDYEDSCDDDSSNIVPYISKTVGSTDAVTDEVAGIAITNGLFKWTLNSTSMLVDWANPTLKQVMEEVTDFETDDSVLQLPDANVWVYLVIETTLAIPHPIHLHGHDYFVLAQGTGSYSSSVTLNLDNPPRRDTAMLNPSGYLVLAFETDNPGVWLMHCHIGWHTSEGFALQFVERYDEIAAITDSDLLTDTCSSWSTFQSSEGVDQDDSGI